MSELLPLSGIVAPGLARPATQIDWLSASSLHGDMDTIHRTITSASVVISTSWPTAHVASQLSAWHANLQADVDALKIVVKFQRKYINYQATYNAFLLGTLSEEEFEEEADAYISEERAVGPAELAPMIERLDRLLEFTLTDREIGEYLEVDHQSLDGAIEYMGPDRCLWNLTIDESAPDEPPSITEG